MVLCKFISECKIDSGENILWKRKTCSVIWLCYENYAGKLFFVFGLTCKKSIFKKGKHKLAPNHHLVHRHQQGKAQPTTNHPKSKLRRGKKPPPLLRYNQNPPKHHHSHHHNNNKIWNQRKRISNIEICGGFGSS